MMKKTLVLAVVLAFAFLIVQPVGAQIDSSAKIPSLNPFCWKKKDCVNIRRGYVTGNPTDEQLALDGFITGASVAPCVGGTGDDEWGRCLPAGQSKTEISFGGQDRFSNIGDFILTMYRYLITVASIVAVIVIIFAGVQWLTSGGNSETISSAKHRISGAIIGLFIAYGSYFILNTINPALVSLRLPQVWLVRPQRLIPSFCRDIPGAKEGNLKFRFYSLESDQVSEVDITKAGDQEMPYRQKDANGLDIFACGRRFLAEDGGTQTCFGDVCGLNEGKRQICTREKQNDPMSCKKGDLAIHLRIDVGITDVGEQIRQSLDDLNWGLFVTKAMETNWLYDTQVFRGVCKDNQTLYLANDGGVQSWTFGSGRIFGPYGATNGGGIPKDPYWEYQYYYTNLADIENMGWNCTKGGELVGYLLRIETHARQSTWDKYKPTLGQVLIPIYGAGAFIYNLLDEGPQPNLNIGYDRSSGQPVFGTFSDDVKTINNYIPIEQLRNGGLSLDIGVTIGKIIRMRGKSGETPVSFPENIDPGVPAQ